MRHFFLLLLALLAPLAAQAQSTVRAGSLRYDSLLHALPQYALVEKQMAELRAKYESETRYNELSFQRQFSEFLQGQKNFPENILLKRQRDLQEQMERSIAFRHEADSLLAAAEDELLLPLRRQLDHAIYQVGLERGYECIVDRGQPALRFVHPSVVEDATPYVLHKLGLAPAPAPAAQPQPAPADLVPVAVETAPEATQGEL